MKIVHGNAVFIREEAKLARNTLPVYVHLQGETSLLSTPLTSLRILTTSLWLQENIRSRDYDVTLGDVFRGAFVFLRIRSASASKVCAEVMT